MPSILAPDMGFPSVYCEYVLLLLVNKEASLTYDKAEYSKGEIQVEIEEETR